MDVHVRLLAADAFALLLPPTLPLVLLREARDVAAEATAPASAAHARLRLAVPASVSSSGAEVAIRSSA